MVSTASYEIASLVSQSYTLDPVDDASFGQVLTADHPHGAEG